MIKMILMIVLMMIMWLKCWLITLWWRLWSAVTTSIYVYWPEYGDDFRYDDAILDDNVYFDVDDD